MRPTPTPVRMAAPAAAPAPAATAPPRLRPRSASAPIVASTVWHPDSERRRAVVELGPGERREVREGETIGSYLVLAIGPAGVVFRRDGDDVTRRVGER
jgi:hypothetical protein